MRTSCLSCVISAKSLFVLWSYTIVPSGTSIKISSPLLPNISLAPPFSPFAAANFRLRRKFISVFNSGVALIKTDPPLPPSPPLGPPRGTYFSLRKETIPSPPAPEITIIFALSINISTSLLLTDYFYYTRKILYLSYFQDSYEDKSCKRNLLL